MGQLRLLGEPPASDDHATLTNLAFPQAGHTGFVAAAGLAGGQTIIGGTAASENLSLQSTAGSPRGVVQIIDALRLVNGLIQDSGGSARIALATASPHLTLTGDVLITAAPGAPIGRMAIAPAAIDPNTWLNLDANLGTAQGTWRGIRISPQLTGISPYSCALNPLIGQAVLTLPSGTSGLLQGLSFIAFVGGAGNVSEMEGVWVRLGSIGGATAAISFAAALYARSGLWLGSKPTRNYGLLTEPQGASGMTDAVGLLVDAPALATNNYTIWAGAPITGTPRLRLDAGTPGAGQTMLYLAEGATPTVRRIEWRSYPTGLTAGDRVMVLV